MLVSAATVQFEAGACNGDVRAAGGGTHRNSDFVAGLQVDLVLADAVSYLSVIVNSKVREELISDAAMCIYCFNGRPCLARERESRCLRTCQY